MAGTEAPFTLLHCTIKMISTFSKSLQVAFPTLGGVGAIITTPHECTVTFSNLQRDKDKVFAQKEDGEAGRRKKEKKKKEGQTHPVVASHSLGITSEEGDIIFDSVTMDFCWRKRRSALWLSLRD